MKRDPSDIAPDINAYLRLLKSVPWFQNLGMPHPRDSEVVRIHRWEECPGPERGYEGWFGRWQSVVQEQIEASVPPAQQARLNALWKRIGRLVLKRAAAHVPLYDPERDSWYGPTACVWYAAFTACLVGWHIALKRRLPERLACEWEWCVAGHWPCDYAQEPPGYWDETTMDLPCGKLLVF